MELECSNITRVVLPAIRINMAEEMSEKYNLNQKEIADRLGIAQVAVSKYLNGRYSMPVKRMRDYIKSRGLVDNIAKRASGISDPDLVNNMINRLCTDIASNNLVV